MKKNLLLIALLACSLFSQKNTWQQTTGSLTGPRYNPGIAYVPAKDMFLMALGTQSQDTVGPYSEMAYLRTENRWHNYLPDSSLYGVWADSTGNAYGRGANTYSTMGAYFIFKTVMEGGKGYLRPGLLYWDNPCVHNQSAYNPDDGKIYYFIAHMTFTYDPIARVWDTLSVGTTYPSYSPLANTKGRTNTALLWSALCFDPVNHEIVLFGGAGANYNKGVAGTWIFNPSTKRWSKPSLAVEPPPRAMSPMVYDPASQCIVLFGGDQLNRLLADTWVYHCDTRTWEKKAPTLSPSPRAGHALLHMPKSGKIVLLGGFDYTSTLGYMSMQYEAISPLQMWRYDVSADEWKLIKSFSSGFIPAINSSRGLSVRAAADTGDRILALCDSAVYQGRFQTCLMECDPLVIDEAGTASLGVSAGATARMLNTQDDTTFWEDSTTADTGANEAYLRNLTPNTWTLITQPKAPSRRVWSTRCYDPDRDRIYVWGGGHSDYYGNTVPAYSPRLNQWHSPFSGEWQLTYNYADWGGVGAFTFTGRPFMNAHPWDAYDYDPVRKNMVLVKDRYTFFFDCDRLDWDTSLYIVNPPSWYAGAKNTSVTGTPRGSVAWVSTAPWSSDFHLALLAPESTSWRELPVTGAKIPIYNADNCGAAYDPVRDQMVFVSLASNITRDSIWVYDFATGIMEKRCPAGPLPLADDMAKAATYVPFLDAVFFQGDWGYDCANNRWLRFNLAKSGVTEINSVSTGVMYDKNRGLIWNVGYGQMSVLKLTADAIASTEIARPKIEALPTAAPNPFSSTTRITCSAARNAMVSVEIYNINGQRVRSLFSGPGHALPSSLSWDGQNFAGKRVASGLYICEIRSGREVKQLPVLRMR